MLTLAVPTVIALTGCGGKKTEEEPPPIKIDAARTPQAAPIAPPRAGVDRIERMNFHWGSPGSREYIKALSAYSKKTRDWDDVRSHAEAALAKDAQHIGAHWLLGAALAQLGENAEAVDHLVTAIAADYFKYGRALATSKDLEAFLATPHGRAVTELADKIHDHVVQRIPKGLLVVGRRSVFRWPSSRHPHDSSSRGELYSYDRDNRQYYRLTHTRDTVVGYARSAKGEIAVLGYDRIDRDADQPPLITRAYVLTIGDDYQQSKRTLISEKVREIGIGYDGDQLLITTAPASGRWGIGKVSVWELDGASRKLVASSRPAPVPRIAFSLEEAHVVRVPEGVEAAWTGEPASAPKLTAAGKTIEIPESGNAARSSVALSGHYLAYATAVDPCVEGAAPSLHVADLEQGRDSHILTAYSHFETRWLDATTLAYEDGEGEIRLWDPTTRRQLPNPLVNKPGIALAVLSLSPMPPCLQKDGKGKTTPGDEASGTDDEPPLPPED